jgi:hypothetical protein
MRPRVSAMRCLPLQLSGGAHREAPCGASRARQRASKPSNLCTDNIARFLEDHAETEGDVAIIMRQQWALDQLPVVTLDAANEPAQMIDDGIVSSALRGTCSGVDQTKPSSKAAS